MTTLSIPIPQDLLDFIDAFIASGEAENRAQAVRKAVRKMREQIEINDILEAKEQIKQGLSYSGNLQEIMDKRRNA